MLTSPAPAYRSPGLARVTIWLALGGASWSLIAGAWLVAMRLIG